MFKLGIDLGGTKIEGVVLDPQNHELFRERVPTEQEQGYEHILAIIHSLYRRMLIPLAGAQHTLGMGTPGSISKQTGLLRNSNTLCLNGKPLQADLQKCLQKQVSVTNDANCFALAEASLGVGRGHDLVFGVIMGTGCGGGIVHHGKIIDGAQGIAGEWGHSSIDPNGPKCWCGTSGCVETFISGGGLERLYQARHGVKEELRAIVTAYRNGKEPAVEFMELFFRNFGRALANIINILDPDLIVLGGGVSNIKELYDRGVREVERAVFSDRFSTRILQNRLGDSAGVIGAALLATDNV